MQRGLVEIEMIQKNKDCKQKYINATAQSNRISWLLRKKGVYASFRFIWANAADLWRDEIKTNLHLQRDRCDIKSQSL